MYYKELNKLSTALQQLYLISLHFYSHLEITSEAHLIHPISHLSRVKNTVSMLGWVLKLSVCLTKDWGKLYIFERVNFVECGIAQEWKGILSSAPSTQEMTVQKTGQMQIPRSFKSVVVVF